MMVDIEWWQSWYTKYETIALDFCTVISQSPADTVYAWYLAATGGKETVLVSTWESVSPHLFHLTV